MIQDPMNERRCWLASAAVDGETKRQLTAQSERECADAFYCDLEFGTGGLRGLTGAGTNRVNVYTVRKVTQGLANHINAQAPGGSVAIAYDSRLGSELFAREAARVLAANGLCAMLYPRLQPTPLLSWAVRDQGCRAGICITASHNPAEYNGYKVYGADGCQITPDAANAIQECIARVRIFEDVRVADFDEAFRKKQLRFMGEDVVDRYLDAVEERTLRADVRGVPLSIVYTPLSGAGLECVLRILEKIGISNVNVVAEQAAPDGRFPTCPSPNPETPEALALGLRDCERLQADLLLATDPDCDRVGVAARGEGGYQLMSGNEIGVLLLDYICKSRIALGTMPEHPVAFTTVVSSDMADAVAARYGVELRRTLTGFKFIGEQVRALEERGELERFLFAFEESYGYLSGAHVRDKDGVNAVLLICEMARWYKMQGMTLPDAMRDLYGEYGFYFERLHSYAISGADGIHRMREFMCYLRGILSEDRQGDAVESVCDYLTHETNLPSADVLEFRLRSGHRLLIRPSGTEPKLKVYTFSRGDSKAGAAEKEREMIRAFDDILSYLYEGAQ